MAGEFCRPVIDSTKRTYLGLGIVLGIVITFLVSWFMGWLRF